MTTLDRAFVFTDEERASLVESLSGLPRTAYRDDPEVLPTFDEDDPVRSKHERKTTFVAEGFLALFAVLTRTEITAHKRAQAALRVLVETLHATRTSVETRPGDCISFSNTHVVHGREIRGPTDTRALQRRWLIKTHNVVSLRRFDRHYLSGRYGVVDG